MTADEANDFAYEPTLNLEEAFRLLRETINACADAPSFQSVLNVCRRCRTAFAEFTGEAIAGGEDARKVLLPRMLDLLQTSRDGVSEAMLQLSNPEEWKLADGYRTHIQRRLELAERLQSHGMQGYVDEIRARLSAALSGVQTAAV
ncbi:hypothetical protein [Prosthecobacter sp.]